jgi:photosystem II stability/assembly factor-like uncharacterized protein
VPGIQVHGGQVGVLKTLDGGVTWANVTTSIATDKVWSSIVIDPSAPSTLYAAIGQSGGSTQNGIYKSTDGGENWVLLTSGPNGTAAGRIMIAVAKSNPQVAYISAASPSTGGLYKFMRSDNGGASFVDLTPGMPDYLGYQGSYDTTLIVDPTDSAVAYAAGQFNIIRSSDSGAHWTDITFGSSGTPGPHVDHHAAAFNANGHYLAGTDGGIYRLDDPLTASWTQLNGNLNTIQFEGIGVPIPKV